MKIFNAKIQNGKNITDCIIFNNKSDISKIDTYETSEIQNNCIEYAFGEGLENDEWFYVNLEDKHLEEIEKYLKLGNSTASLSVIQKGEYDFIKFCYLINTITNEIIFTNVTKTNFLKNKSFIRLGDLGPIITEIENCLSLPNGQIDLYFNGQDRLFFKRFEIAKKIFPDMSDFYREATKKELTSFFEDNDFIEIGEKMDKERIGQRNLKSIALLIDQNKIDFKVISVRKKYNDYAKEFIEEDLPINDEGKFIINSNADLSNFLKILQGKYFKNYLDPEIKMEATNCKQINSKTK